MADYDSCENCDNCENCKDCGDCGGKETKKFGAKSASLAAKIVGGVCVVAGLALKIFGNFNFEMDDVLKGAFALVAIFGTVDVNIALDKVFGREKNNF